MDATDAIPSHRVPPLLELERYVARLEARVARLEAHIAPGPADDDGGAPPSNNNGEVCRLFAIREEVQPGRWTLTRRVEVPFVATRLSVAGDSLSSALCLRGLRIENEVVVAPISLAAFAAGVDSPPLRQVRGRSLEIDLENTSDASARFHAEVYGRFVSWL